VRFLRINDIPAGATLAMFCAGPDCPTGIVVRYFKNGASSFSLTRVFGHRTYRPGTRLEGWLLKANAIGVVGRVTVRRHRKPKEEQLCVLPTDTIPHPCPF
jgi:hypothetical protein